MFAGLEVDEIGVFFQDLKVLSTAHQEETLNRESRVWRFSCSLKNLDSENYISLSKI